MSQLLAGVFFTQKMCFLLKPGCYGVAVARRGFFSPQKCVFILKPGCCGVAVPAGAFFRPKSDFSFKTNVFRPILGLKRKAVKRKADND